MKIKKSELEKDELSEYTKISEKLIKFFDSETGKYKDDPIVTNLLIKRKNIIHKAKQKLPALIKIVSEIGVDNFSLIISSLSFFFCIHI